MLAIYTRLSQDDVDSNSIYNQKREGKAFAKKEKLAHKFYDEGKGVSGRLEIEDRPKLYQLMKDISSKEITHVWFRNQNRLERNSNTFHIFAALTRKNNVKVYFNNKLDDWNNPNAFLQSSILTALNEYQASLQSYQTKRVLLDNAKEGKSFGIYPYGYKSEDGYLVINENERGVVETIYNLSLNGMGTRSIAEYLNDEEIPTRYNKIGKGNITVKNKYTGKVKKIEKKDIKWSGNSVRGIIINTIYKGKRKWGNHYFEAPAVFDEVYWQKVNDNLKNNSNNKGKKVIHRYLLKGLLRCGVCERNMYGRSRVSKKDHYYQCSSKRYKGQSCGNRSINIDKIEGVVWSRFFKGDELLSLLRKDVVKEDNQIQELEKSINKHLKKLDSFQKELDRLISLSVREVFTDEEILKEKKNIKYNIGQQEKFIRDYKLQISNAKNSQQLIDEYVREFQSYSDSITFLEKKKIVNKYIKEIVVDSLPKNHNVYVLIFRFKTSIKEEGYLFLKKEGILLSLNDKEMVMSKYTNSKVLEQYQRVLKLDKHIIIEQNGEARFIPVQEVENGMAKILFNTIIPYGKLSDWNKEKIINFYSENPNWLCDKSGLSIISIDETKKGYKEAISRYKKFINKPLTDWVISFDEIKYLI